MQLAPTEQAVISYTLAGVIPNLTVRFLADRIFSLAKETSQVSK